MATEPMTQEELAQVRGLLDVVRVAPDGDGVEIDALRLPTIRFSAVREAAKAWGQTIAALTGAAGALTLIQGDDKIGGLVSDDENRAITLLVLAFVAAVVAIVLGFVAAWVRRPFGRRDGPSLGITLSMIAAGLAAALVAVAVVIIATGTPEEKDQPRYLVHYEQSGAVACDELVRVAGGLALKAAPTPLANVASIEKVDACPK